MRDISDYKRGKKLLKKIYHSCMIAFSMFSKIPVPNCDWSEENMAYMMCFFPWVGVVVGGLTGLWGTAVFIR